MIKQLSPLLTSLMERAKLTEDEAKVFYYVMFRELTPRQIVGRDLLAYSERNVYYLYKKARRKINKVLP